MSSRDVARDVSIQTGRPVSTPYLGKGTQLLLDQHPGAAAAYSLRKLREDYSGNSLRVRRGSDNVEREIGFDGDVVDTQALVDFSNGKDVFVVRWYDQSPNQRDASQSTQQDQPQIVASGSVVTESGEPTVRFGGTSEFLSSSSFSLSTSDLAVFVAVSLNSGNGGSILTMFSYGGYVQDGFVFQRADFQNRIRYAEGGSALKNYQVFTDINGFSLISLLDRSGGKSNVSLNGSLGNSQSISSDLNGSKKVVIGRREDSASQYWDGEISEVIFYPNDKSSARSEIEDDINSYYNIF